MKTSCLLKKDLSNEVSKIIDQSFNDARLAILTTFDDQYEILEFKKNKPEENKNILNFLKFTSKPNDHTSKFHYKKFLSYMSKLVGEKNQSSFYEEHLEGIKNIETRWLAVKSFIRDVDKNSMDLDDRIIDLVFQILKEKNKKNQLEILLLLQTCSKILTISQERLEYLLEILVKEERNSTKMSNAQQKP